MSIKIELSFESVELHKTDVAPLPGQNLLS